MVARSASLASALLATEGQGLHRFFVPAHAGRPFHPVYERFGEALAWDLTELPLLDTLSEPQEVLANLQKEIAEWSHAGASFCLVNGASVGLHAALMSVCSPSDVVLAPRNIHRATYAGFIHAGVRPHWFYPTYQEAWGLWGAVTCTQLTQAWERLSLFEQAQVSALVLTSPTYEGMLSPLPELVQWCHARGIVCVVDESHGSHFSIPSNPSSQHCVSALQAGADVVVQSWHKTLGSLTQSAVLHLGKDFATPERILRVQQVLNTLQTTSPSYLLLASLEATLHYWQSSEGQACWEKHQARVERLYRHLETHLTQGERQPYPFDSTHHDPLKLWIRHGLYPNTVPEDLEETDALAFEQCTPYGVLYMLHPHLPDEAFQTLQEAWLRMAQQPIPPQPLTSPPFLKALSPLPLPDMCLSPREAFFHQAPKTYVVHPKACVGCMAAEVVVHCPPGVPIVYTGEVIQEPHLPWLFPTHYGLPSDRTSEGVWVFETNVVS
jgi:arginine decarboxylase